MPLGLTDSGDMFQCCIEETLSGLDGVCAYVNGILVYVLMKEAHVDILWNVL